MFRRIIVPLDGSPLAEAILPWVRDLAASGAAEVHLVAVATPPHDLGLRERGGPYVGQVSDAAGIRLEEYLRDQAAVLQAAGIAVSTHLATGNPAEQIVRCARELEASVIAMSTHGRGGVDRLLHGSVAGSVLQTAGRPVLLLRPPPATFAAQREGKHRSVTLI